MKKYLLFALSAAFMLLMVSLMSCGNDEDENGNSLICSTFATLAYHSDGTPSEGIEPYDAYFVLKFTGENTCEFSVRKNSPTGELIGKTYRYLYVYDDPRITLSTTEGSSIDGTFISADVFRVSKWAGLINLNNLEFKKQSKK